MGHKALTKSEYENIKAGQRMGQSVNELHRTYGRAWETVNRIFQSDDYASFKQGLVAATKPVSTDLSVVRAYTHKGITIGVGIDFVKSTVSLVENTDGRFKPKKWEFSGRGLAYMQSWQNILDAMKFAIAEATKELEAQKERHLDEIEKLMVALAINDLDKKGA